MNATAAQPQRLKPNTHRTRPLSNAQFFARLKTHKYLNNIDIQWWGLPREVLGIRCDEQSDKWPTPVLSALSELAGLSPQGPKLECAKEIMRRTMRERLGVGVNVLTEIPREEEIRIAKERFVQEVGETQHDERAEEMQDVTQVEEMQDITQVEEMQGVQSDVQVVESGVRDLTLEEHQSSVVKSIEHDLNSKISSYENMSGELTPPNTPPTHRQYRVAKTPRRSKRIEARSFGPIAPVTPDQSPGRSTTTSPMTPGRLAKMFARQDINEQIRESKKRGAEEMDAGQNGARDGGGRKKKRPMIRAWNVRAH